MRDPNSNRSERDLEEYPDPEAYRRTLIENVGQYNAKLIQDPSDQTPREYKLTYQNPFEGEIELHFNDAKKAALHTSLLITLGDFSQQDVGDDGVPLKVALDGRPAIAAYLYVVQEEPTREIAATLGVDRRTVWDYWSKIRQRAREDPDTVEWKN
ncbi:hypothetical protein [Halopiger xanaduensis]|uniref:Uncharacterized protein n=1 Tax=Halopiger xanaduensis (strain DSM 18323 / JCM 14033 / SH-6) TaxID=797210 RepID=F8DBY2_HALXS|nr:hypothetical protein [Halopiger xanaduensis]AEH35958.1 hypothetical protein Halxa_1325 [Halopiger xanaduensis SH-6]